MWYPEDRPALARQGLCKALRDFLLEPLWDFLLEPLACGRICARARVAGLVLFYMLSNATAPQCSTREVLDFVDACEILTASEAGMTRLKEFRSSITAGGLWVASYRRKHQKPSEIANFVILWAFSNATPPPQSPELFYALLLFMSCLYTF